MEGGDGVGRWRRRPVRRGLRFAFAWRVLGGGKGGRVRECKCALRGARATIGPQAKSVSAVSCPDVPATEYRIHIHR